MPHGEKTPEPQCPPGYRYSAALKQCVRTAAAGSSAFLPMIVSPAGKVVPPGASTQPQQPQQSQGSAGDLISGLFLSPGSGGGLFGGGSAGASAGGASAGGSAAGAGAGGGSAAGGGAAAGAGQGGFAALASNPIGWIILAALSVYGLDKNNISSFDRQLRGKGPNDLLKSPNARKYYEELPGPLQDFLRSTADLHEGDIIGGLKNHPLSRGIGKVGDFFSGLF